MRADPGNPLAPERIVVPRGTVGRWLSLELARELGISANLKFELPAGFAWSVMRGAIPGLPTEQPFAPAQLRWRVHEVLPRFADEDREGREVRRYLADGDPRKRFALADRLARAFDRYVVYRPDWIRDWSAGDAPHWQARLWRRVVEAEGSTAHWVGAIDAFRAAIESGVRPAEWPLRATFFAVPALSPSYLDVLGGIGRGIDLRLFVLNPCREYWGDIYSRREIGRRADGADPAERYLIEGNELLAAWGRSGRDTFDSLVEVAGGDGEECFVDPTGLHRLASVQRDVLDLRLASEGCAFETDAGGGGTGGAGAAECGAPRAVADGAGTEGFGVRGTGMGPTGTAGRDDSLRIHVCHSPVREVEVLHDRLLGLFDAHPDLGPADVLVLTPDLERYGPAVEAVFGAAARIPFHVARRRSAASPAVRAFFELLAMRRSRLGAESMLSPLDAETVRARFGIAESSLPVIRGWVREAGIRWGVDAEHREAEGLPATGDHAWRQGLRRLLLGYALPDPNELFAGIVPCPPRTGGFEPGADEADLLGRFVTWCEAVFTLRARLDGERPPREWARVLHEEIGRFFAGVGTEPAAGTGTGFGFGSGVGTRVAAAVAEEVDEVRGLVRAFEREAGRTDSPLGSDVVHDVLLELADAPSRDAARLADGVTVTSLTPGQVFPSEVVCVIGLNDGAFPRSPSFPSFDLVASGPVRRGDRDVRHEDRFVFLEALLATRRAFLVSYTGRGQRDDAPIPPAAVVDELKDYLGRRFPGVSFETSHPLQPFSPRYFASSGEAEDGPEAQSRDEADRELFSYSEGMCEAARSLVSDEAESAMPSRFEAALPEPLEPPEREGSERRVALTELVAFFAGPVRWFLRERLGVRLELDDASLEDEEPFELDDLERYWLRSDILDRMRAGVTRRRDEALQRGSGRLPQAALGGVVHGRAWKEVEGLHRILGLHCSALESPPIEIDVEVDGWRVTGSVENLGPDGFVWWRPGRLRARDRIAIRLTQLALAAAGSGPPGALALSLERNAAKGTPFSAPEDGREHLARWLRAWRGGHSAALPFFPETSLRYASALARDGSRTDALERARTAWSGGPSPWNRGGEATRDPYLRLVYGDREPLTEEFEALAADLLLPLAEAVQ